MNRRRTAARVATTALVVALATAGIASLPGPDAGADSPRATRAPNQSEYALLALSNLSRSQPSLPEYGAGPESVQPPLIWNHQLATAARVHTYDMIENGCYQHNSCNGQSWWTRIKSYYDNGLMALAENIIFLGNPRQLHAGWMNSPGHRRSILSGSFNEFGAGFDIASEGDGFEYATQDFGIRSMISLRAYPAVPAAAVLDPKVLNAANWDYEFLVNYYDYDRRAPVSVDAIVDGQRRPLSLQAGTTWNGSWNGLYPTAKNTQQCKHVYFEVQRSGDNAVIRWPETGDIAFGRRTTPDGDVDLSCWNPYAEMPGAIPIPPVISPTVVIDSPAAGTETGIVQIRAHATDDGKVKNMEVWIDGKRVLRNSRASVVKRWNMAPNAVIPGPHTIVVKAFDNEGNVGTASVVVTK